MKYQYSESNRASYCPEDDKLRLYVGRVPRPEYDALRAEGWRATPKQAGDFTATWTPGRRDTCLQYADIIEDEDGTPEDRAADRAERFGGYRDKREGEALGLADRFDRGPGAHGYQSQARADRSAARHDRVAGYACDAWSKAEYWQRRTAGVISHALYVSRPDVRMGRIKTIEAEQRKHAAHLDGYAKLYRCFQKMAAMEDPEKQNGIVRHYLGTRNVWAEYMHPRPETVENPHIKENASSLYTLMTMTERGYGSSDITGAEACALFFSDHPEPAADDDWSRHYALRLAYENQMLEAQGGRAAHVEMIAGGWLGTHQIQKVNKSNVTGRVVSVAVLVPTHGCNRYGNPYPEGVKAPTHRLENIETERLASSVYRPPTPEELEKFLADRKAEKKAAPKKETIPLVNPTDDDAQRLQDAWNERARDAHEKRNIYSSPEARASHSAQFKPAEVTRIPQAVYSANSQGSYARAETRGVCRNMVIEPKFSNLWSSEAEKRAKDRGPAVCTIRRTWGTDSCHDSVIVITDKPQKPLPAAVWALPTPAAPAFALTA